MTLNPTSTHTGTETPQPVAGSPNRRPILFLIAALVILADRLSKDWIVRRIRPGYTIPIIPHVFHLSHVLNTGAAFSLLENMPPNAVRMGLVIFSVIAVIFVLVLLWRTGRTLTLTSVAFALILGGALGNLYDRIRFRHVVDFLAVNIYHYHWPDFNVADSCIVIGTCLLLIEIFRPVPTESQRPDASLPDSPHPDSSRPDA